MWTVRDCTIHSTHSVYYSILHIFMFRDLRIMLQCKLLFLWNWYNHYNRVTVVYRDMLILPPRGWDLPSFPFLLTLNSEMIQSVAAELLCFFCSVCRWRTDVGWSENRRKEWGNRGGLSIRDAKQSQKKCFRYISPSSSSYVCGFWWWHDFSVCVIFKVWFGLMGLFFSVVG